MAPDLLGRLPRPTGSAATGGVKEPECRLPRAKRMELGKNLPWRELWGDELGALKRRENKTPEERRQFVETGKKALNLVGSQR